MDIRIRFLLVCGVLIASIVAMMMIPINLGLDLQGGMRVVVEAKDTATFKVNNETMQGVQAVIRNRVDGLGISEPVIFLKGDRQVVVELPGVKNPDHALKMIGETALLEFVEAEWAPGDASVLTPEKVALLAGPDARLDKVVVKDNTGKIIRETPIILKKMALTGNDLKWAGPGTDQYGNPIINIEFSPEGSKKFAEATQRSVGRPLAIILDGKIISAPNVNEPIFGGKAQISGSFSIDEVTDMVIKLKAGSLPIPVEVVENKSVGASLGQDSIHKSLVAGIAGFIAVAIFIILYYRLSGMMAILALILYFLIDMAILMAFHVTFTLPGIAGIILSLGMAVDANVIIFEWIMEQRRLGVSIMTSVETGFQKAFTTIFDSNITTLITAFVLFWLGTGSIRGFAITLTIGILVSMFSAIFITKTFMLGLTQWKIAESKWYIKG